MKDFYIEWREICKCIDRICDCVEDADFDGIKGIFLNAKAVTDVRPVRRGRWEPRDLTFGRSIYECSNCKLGLFVPEMNGNPGYPYCPNCGADMREDET